MDWIEIVAYLRVSTDMQGLHGLGMEAQRHAVEAYAASRSLPIVASYQEVETGRKDDLKNRPQLVSAVAHAKRSGALLVIARLDRLARSVYVTSQLLSSGVEFVACDNPHANRLTIQILAVMAEYEGKLISERTKAGLAAAKARGVIFGNGGRYLTPAVRALAAERAALANRKRAKEAYVDLLPLILALRAGGSTMVGIARTLNAAGHRTQRRNPWTTPCVRRLLEREGLLERYPVDRHRNNITDVVAKLGNAASALESKTRTRAAYRNVAPIVLTAYADGNSLSSIAKMLNTLGHKTQHWLPWSCSGVRSLLIREGVRLREAQITRFSSEQQRSGVVAAVDARRRHAHLLWLQVAPIAIRLRETGHTFSQVADHLNEHGYRTSRKKHWSGSLVWVLLNRNRFATG